MTINQIYQLAIDMGMKADPRGEKGAKEFLARLKKEFDELPEKKKKYFDKESLDNPYSDTRILFGNPDLEVKKILAGIDAEEAEVLLLDRLNQKGDKYDLLLSHHPSGHALSALDEVVDLQVDLFAEHGVPENVAQSMFNERSAYVRRRFSPLNHARAIDAARLLNVPLMSIHTVWDNLGWRFITDYVSDKKFANLGELYDHIMEIPEYAEAARGKAAPNIVLGNPKSRVGKIAFGFTGGTNPSKELYVELVKAGIGTFIDMHLPEEALEELKKLHVNAIDTGHMASDSIGANIFLDELEKQGITVVPCSGLIRIKRTK